MAHGAALLAAQQAGARIVDPRAWASSEIAPVYSQYPHIGPVLPAMGYSHAQIDALRETLNACDAELIVAGTPVDLAALMPLNKPVIRARYEFAELEQPGLWDLVRRLFTPESRSSHD
jgi:predicted GTPase